MATHTIIPVSEYLTTEYSPDCDYVDGEVQERNLGEQDHSDLQTQFAYLLRTGDSANHLRINTELRVQVSRDPVQGPGCMCSPAQRAKRADHPHSAVDLHRGAVA
jgi:hypothetical protein